MSVCVNGIFFKIKDKLKRADISIQVAAAIIHKEGVCRVVLFDCC